MYLYTQIHGGDGVGAKQYFSLKHSSLGAQGQNRETDIPITHLARDSNKEKRKSI